MNNVIETINNRVSLRVYKDTPISDEDLNIILNSAIKAPTAGNMMMYSILKIKSDKTKEKLKDIFIRASIYELEFWDMAYKGE